MQQNLQQTLNHAIKLLTEHYQSPEQATHVAWFLLEAITKKSRLHLLVHTNYTLSKTEQEQLSIWLTQHITEQYPLQYLLGSVPFGPLEILVQPPILIPRPETESWCAELITTLQPCVDKKLTILDMCSGSGCIGLWLAQALPTSSVISIDISPDAIALGKKNAAHNRIKNIKFVQSDLFSGLKHEHQFDLMVSNPPYITPESWLELDPVVKKWEDKHALMAEDNGLALITKIIDQAPEYLKKTGPLFDHALPRLLLEIGYDQGPKVAELCKNRGFDKVEIVKDEANHDRVVCSW
jgi:release factor glutamine methyltransferase